MQFNKKIYNVCFLNCSVCVSFGEGHVISHEPVYL